MLFFALRETLTTMWIGGENWIRKEELYGDKEISVPQQGVVADYMNGKKRYSHVLIIC